MHRITALAGLAFALLLIVPVASPAQAPSDKDTGQGKGANQGKSADTGPVKGMGMGQGQGAGYGHGQVCREAMKKLCPDFAPGTQEFRDCVFSKVDELPDECRGGAGPHGKGMQAFAVACKTEMKTHCSDVERGGGRIFACLDKNKASLSKECADAVEKARAWHEQRMGAGPGMGMGGKPGAPKGGKPAPADE